MSVTVLLVPALEGAGTQKIEIQEFRPLWHSIKTVCWWIIGWKERTGRG